MKPLKSLALLLFLAKGGFPALAGPVAPAPDTRQLVDRVTSNLVCVCGCANMVVRNCTCLKAAEMEQEVSELAAQGKTERQIYSIAREKYGDCVLASPTAQGFNLLAWVLPFLGLAIGLIIVAVVIRRLLAAPAKAPAASVAPTVMDPKYRRMLEKALRE